MTIVGRQWLKENAVPQAELAGGALRKRITRG